jgi:O-antigen ligase
MGGRAKSTFKDPNVYAPFLILPLLFLVEGTLREGVRPLKIATAGVLVVALLLAFSRGGWVNAAASASIMMFLMFVAARSVRLRGRILFLGLLALAGIAALIVLLVSFESIGGLFKERAALVQYYDVGEAGRFGNQIRSLSMLLERPNGLGPLEFGAIFPQAPHNVYLNAFSAYGWLGGITYLLLILTSLAIGFQHALTRTPWQPFFIPIYAAFVGVVLEGAIVDTDHWRHFFLLLGAVWGLSAATIAHVRRAPAPPPVRSVAPSPASTTRHFVVSRIG